MKKSTIISKRPLSPKNLDYDFLYNEAIKYLQELSGEIWTDYNIHDPGVTILEYLCYGITDLGYRTELSVEDLLYARINGKEEKIRDTLFSPEDIYPSAPLTPTDYRKLLLDSVADLQNCWIEKDNPVDGQTGLSTVFLQLNDWKASGDKDIKKDVKKILAENRNLGEDFSSIEFLRKQKIGISAEISIRYSSYAEAVMSKILVVLDDFFSAPVMRTSIKSLSENGVPLEKILEGPLLKNGYIDQKHLQSRRKGIDINEIKGIILDVAGVLNIREIHFQVNGSVSNKEFLLFENDQFPTYDKGFMHLPQLPISLDKDGRKVPLDLIEVKRTFNSDINRLKYQRISNNYQKKTTVPSKIDREDLAHYTSIQNFFPHIYGITRSGVPLRAPKAQRVKAKQLKGYLLLFEHFFSTYLANLSHLPQLFSITEENSSPQFNFLPLDVPDINLLLQKGEEKDNIEEKMKALFLKSAPTAPVKNAILNHLLARFNEEFPNENFSANTQDCQDLLERTNLEKIIEDKKKFLEIYPELSRKRGTGFNYDEPAWNNNNVSGLKKRVSLQLGFPEFKSNYLAKHVFNGERLKKPSEQNGAKSAQKQVKVKIPVHDLLIYGTEKVAYHIVEEEAKHEVYFHSPEMSERRLIYQADTHKKCAKAIENLRREVLDINAKSTGFFIVDHILLRPKKQMRHGLYLYDETGKLLLENHKEVKNEDLDRNSIFLFILGINRDNFKSEAGENNCFRIVLYDENQKPIMISSNDYSEEEVSQEITRINNWLIALKKQPDKINKVLILKNKIQYDARQKVEIPSDFYNAQLSFIFPKWISQFFNRENREYIKNVIIENMPAHLQPHFYWLSIGNMRKFEDIFKEWLSVIDNVENRDNLSLELAKFLITTDK